MAPDPDPDPATMTPDDLRFRIAAGRRILYREGCDSNVGGHVSARAEDGDGFWVTGFEYLDQTVAANVAKLDFDLNPLVGEHELSPAVNFHALIYRRRPDVNAIVHVHYHHISVLFHEEQATYFDDGVRPHTDVVDALGPAKHVVLMKNHGAIVASDSVENAVIEAI